MSEWVFFIDDDPGIRCVAEQLVTAAGLNFEGYGGPLTFLEEFDRDHVEPSVIIVDLIMPHMTGLELMRAAQQRKIHFPFILISGHADIGITVEAFRAGAFDFVEKPFSTTAFLIAVHRALSNSRDQLELLEQQREITRRVSILTQREATVLRMLVTGATNKEVARELGISHRTVEHHRQQGIKKLGLQSAIELGALFWIADLIEMPSVEPSCVTPQIPLPGRFAARLLQAGHALTRC